MFLATWSRLLFTPFRQATVCSEKQVGRMVRWAIRRTDILHLEMAEQIKLDFETVKGLCEFILLAIADGPASWQKVASDFLKEGDLENCDEFRWLFSRCIAQMLAENWLAKATDDPLFEIGLTFKGGTVLRHRTEINAFYDRHFAAAIRKTEQAKAAAQAKREKHLKAAEKARQKAERKAEKRKKKTRNAKTTAAPINHPKSAKIDLFGSGKKIRASIPSKDNDQLLKLWKSNTLGAANSSGAKRDQHLQIVAAIEREWRRRIMELPESEAFKWPSTDVGFGSGGGNFERQEISYLKILGYTVGKTDGLPASSRRLILDRCFSGQLPPYQSISEMRKWGDPKSSLRLKKMAYHIASLAKNFKKMPSRGYDDAIADWEDDLKYLHEKYYVRYFRFAWPSK